VHVLSALLTFVTGFAAARDADRAAPDRRPRDRRPAGPAWSINIESMPAGSKATAVTIIMLGFSPAARWPAGDQLARAAIRLGGVFFFCGAATGAARDRAVRSRCPNRSAGWPPRAARRRGRSPLCSRFDPALRAGATPRSRCPTSASSAKVSPWAKSAELFRGTLAWITPIIWFTYFFSSFAIYLKASFGVLFLEQLGIERDDGRQPRLDQRHHRCDRGVLLLWLTEKRGPGVDRARAAARHSRWRCGSARDCCSAGRCSSR
jgi:AAHS family 4-hydroxybenzoate transporter-like MFS transporter